MYLEPSVRRLGLQLQLLEKLFLKYNLNKAIYLIHPDVHFKVEGGTHRSEFWPSCPWSSQPTISLIMRDIIYLSKLYPYRTIL